MDDLVRTKIMELSDGSLQYTARTLSTALEQGAIPDCNLNDVVNRASAMAQGNTPSFQYLAKTAAGPTSLDLKAFLSAAYDLYGKKVEGFILNPIKPIQLTD